MLKNNFSSREDICEEFKIDSFSGTVIYADYEYQNYEGDAAVIFANQGKLYMVSGSHCSCNGLENSWHPDEVTIDMLARIAECGWGRDKEAAQYVIDLVDELGTSDPDAIVGALELLGAAH